MKYLSLAVVFMSSVWAFPVFANTSQFGVIAGDFQITTGEWSTRRHTSNGSTCSTCHSRQADDPALRLSANTVAAEAPSVTVTVEGLASSDNYIWNYRIGGSSEVIDNVNTANVPIGTTARPEIEYCIIDRLSSPRLFMNFHCGTLVVQRAQNQAPSISVSPGGTIDIMADASRTVEVTGVDPDGAEADLVFSASSSQRIASVTTSSTTSNGKSTYTIKAGPNAGSATVTATVTDNNGRTGSKSASTTINVNVIANPTNMPPQINAIADQTLTEGDSNTITVTAVDEGTVVFTLDDLSDSDVLGVTDQGGGKFLLNAKKQGTAEVTILATDDENETDRDTFLVTVNPDNTIVPVPIISPISPITIAVDASVSVTVVVPGFAEASLMLSVTGNTDSDAVSVSVDSGLTVSVKGLKEGVATIELTVTGPGNLTGTILFQVTVTDSSSPNTAPVISSLSPLTIQSGESGTLSVTASDEDVASLKLTIQRNSNPAVLGATLADGLDVSLQGISAGQSTLDLIVTDAGGLTDTASVTVTVNSSNSAPVIDLVLPGRDVTLDVDSTLEITVSVTDETPLASLKFLATSSDTSVFTVAGGDSGKFTLTGQRADRATLNISVEDESGAVTTTDVNVTVQQGNLAPVAVNDQFVFTFDTPDQLLAVVNNDSDPEGSALMIRLDVATTALGGTIEVVNAVQSIVYTPPAVFSSEDSFSYQVVDAAGQTSNVATVVVKPSDTDGDGRFDGVDNCRFLTNADQRDLDGDNMGDLCDSDPDGDGILGLAGLPFTSGRALVERICLDCHRVGLVGSPEFGNNTAWAARIQAAGGVQPLLDSVTLGKGEMPAWGREYTARELTQAVFYITGLEAPGQIDDDRDLDGIDDLNDNCINHPNSRQTDSDNNGVGDECEPDRNGDGILDYSLSFTMYQETPTGRVTGGIARANGGEVTLLARTRADIDGLSFDWSDNSARVLALLGSVTTGEVVTFTPTESDIGVYDILVKMQGAGLTGSTRARLVVTGNTGVDLSDTDYDGYPASLDDDNGNANRVLTNPQMPADSSIFYSDQSITLGRFTAHIASRKSYSFVSAVLSEAEFLEAARALEPGVTPVADSIIGRSIGVINFELRDLDTETANIRLNLSGNVPLNAEFKLYDASTATWSAFVESSTNSLFSAPSESSECPATNSSNYSAGMTAAHACVRFRLTDGGPNDADGVRDGVISIIGAIGTVPMINDGGNPEDINLTPGKSGGGSGGWLVLIVLLGSVARRYSGRLHSL